MIFKAILALLFVAITTAFVTPPAPTAGVKVGDKAPEFKLKNIDGKMVSMADYKDAAGFIVIFSCNHCPFVVKYEDRIEALNKKYASQGVPVICINPNDDKSHPDDSFDKMIVRAKEKGFTFPYLRDDSQEIAKKYGAEKTPHVYLVKREIAGGYKVAYIGAIDDNANDAAAVKDKYLENAVDAMKAGRPIAVKETKAVGCGIKWKK